LKVALEDMGQFSVGPINKDVPSFGNNLTEYVKGDGRHSRIFFSTQTVFTLPVFEAELS